MLNTHEKDVGLSFTHILSHGSLKIQFAKDLDNQRADDMTINTRAHAQKTHTPIYFAYFG